MTPQEIFNTVATHLFTQGERAMYYWGVIRCAYRNDSGQKCAVGCLIPDEVYNTAMEDMGVVNLVKTFGALPTFIASNLCLLEMLQNVHDDATAWATEKTLKKRLRRVSEKYSLDSSILETLHLPKKP